MIFRSAGTAEGEKPSLPSWVQVSWDLDLEVWRRAVLPVVFMRRTADAPSAANCTLLSTDKPLAKSFSGPRGDTFHWVKLNHDGRIKRYHATSPSFVNWHGFHRATETFAFQDLPIILADPGFLPQRTHDRKNTRSTTQWVRKGVCTGVKYARHPEAEERPPGTSPGMPSLPGPLSGAERQS